MPRISSLSVCAHYKLLNTYVPTIGPSESLQHLTHLRISSSLYLPQPLSDSVPYAPALRSLRLDSGSLSCSAPIFRSDSLVELRIEIFRRTEKEIKEMFAALHVLQNLEVLSLNMGYTYNYEWRDWAVTDLTFPTSTTYREPIHLRKLRTMRFAGTLVDCVQFMDRIIVPADASAYIHIFRVQMGANGPLDHGHSIYQAVASHFGRRSADPNPGQSIAPRFIGIQSLVAEGFQMDITSRYASVYAEDSPRSDDHVDWTKVMQNNGMDPLLSLVVHDKDVGDEGRSDTIGPMVLGLCAALPTVDVTTLVIDHTTQYFRDEWSKISTYLGALETIIVKNLVDTSALEDFVYHLSDGRPKGDGLEGAPFFPSLEQIFLEGEHRSLLSILVVKLRERHEQGRGLRLLWLSYCTVDQRDEFQSFVDQVIVGTLTA
ncbi:hypothetical protein EVG20_g5834 [Dentipellis fragilis]|uniref:F-box domain-containing protein n=1 Tax=Dentipellis fragilis TaxID=205917 RepID=A0A4Y9YRJ7_9AGAM|nr:hypothetical protein EVG20_g5834 [Dentipellis fragilis]